MKRAFFGGCALGALMVAMAVPANAAGVTLTGTVGVGGLTLPSSGSSTEDDTVSGAYLGLDGTIDVGPVAGYEGLIGFSLWTLTGGSTSSSTSTTLTGTGTLIAPGYSVPAGTIDLNSDDSSNGAISSAIVSDTPSHSQTATLDPSNDAVTDGWGVVGDNNGFIYGGLSDGTSAGDALAFGAIATPDGGIFIANGNLEGITVSSERTRDVDYSGGSLNFGLGTVKDGGTAISGYVGPAFRVLNQSFATNIAIDIPSMYPGDEFPEFTISRDDTLDSTYFGGVAGFSLSQPVSNGMILSLGGEVGAYGMHTKYNGSESYGVNGGASAADDVGFGGDAGVTDVAVDNTVVNSNAFTMDDDGTAYSVGLNGAISIPVAQQMQISLGLGADYLSRVATLTDPSNANLVNSPNYDSSGNDGNLSSAPMLSFGSAWSWKVTASLTGHF